MTRLNTWTVALPISAVALAGLLCWTTIKFQGSSLHISIEALGMKLEAGVER